MRVLFICSANMCRSPMAEGYLRKIIADQGRDDIEVLSAALYYDAGSPATDGARGIARRHNFDLSNHRSRAIDDELFAWADIIFVMTRDHRAHLIEAWGDAAEGKVIMLGSFDPQRWGIREPEISDPYGSRDITYEDVFAQIRRAIDAWLESRRSAPTRPPDPRL